MPKVICTSLGAEQGPHHEILRAAGFDCSVVARDVDLYRNDELIRVLAGCDAVIAGSEPYPPRVIEALPNLRAIARTGVGFDAVDLAACDQAGIVVATTPGVNHHSVAEHAFALLFGLARGFPDSDRRVREGRWVRISRPRVMGSTLGIVGLGRIGQAVHSRAVGVGMNVVAYDPYPNAEYVRRTGIEMVGLEDLLARSDWVSLHLPVVPETKHLVNRRTLALMKPGAVLLNTARGALVDEEALVEALRAGRLRAAGLDVFEQEPLPTTSPLLALDNVLLSGHLAGLDDESHADTFRMSADTIIALRDGGWPAERIQNLRGTTGWRWQR
jgi:phosphoglycerate dehydrogenase-like enzyme